MSSPDVSWLDLLSDSDDEQKVQIDQPASSNDKLPPKTIKFDSNTGIRTVVSYELIDENTQGVDQLLAQGFNAIKVTQKFRVEVRLVKKAVADRKKLKKFGLAANDKPGPNPSTTSCREEIAIQYVENEMDDGDLKYVDKSEELGTTVKKIGVSGIQCAHCKQSHLSHACPNRPVNHEDKKNVLPISPQGFNETSANGITEVNKDFEESNVIRVTNLPAETRDDDLRELFSKFGPILKARIARDYKTQRQMEYAFVTFKWADSAMLAIRVMNNYIYGHHVLGVHKANSRRR
ncbi:hypothetical protein ACOME3_006617 [Neoechinorhynchus agilis]